MKRAIPTVLVVAGMLQAGTSASNATTIEYTRPSNAITSASTSASNATTIEYTRPPNATTIELITNGDFSAMLSGWTVTDLAGGDGSWFASTVGSPTPLSTFDTSAMTNPGAAAAGGYAVSDQGGPGTHVLEQTFTVPAASSSVTLSFDMFVNDYGGGPIIDPIGLDHTGPPNQHVRVDIMTAAAGPFDTGTGVLGNLFLGIDPMVSNPNPFTNYTFDITGLVGAGGTFKVRFGEVDNLFFLNQGVDNVSISAIPEPNTLALTAIAGVACLSISRRRNRR